MNNSLRSLTVIRELAEQGHRIFSVEDVHSITQSIGLKDSYVPQLLRRYVKEGTIEHLYRGTYCLNQSLLSGPPLTEYEIANYIVKPSAIAYWSAFSIHHLTEQVLRTVFIIAPKENKAYSSKSIFKIKTTTYKILKIQKNYFFGIERKFLTEAPILVTDLERTFIDSLVRPDLCGGFRESLEAFQVGWNRVDKKKLIEYGHKYGVSVLKRIGWICENLGLENPYLEELRAIPCSSFYKLDVSRKFDGSWSRTWNLRENL